MKKLFVFLFSLILSLHSFAQFQGMDPVPKAFNQVKIGKLFWIATEDTTSVSASSYPGAITFRSGDSAHYVSNGIRWIKLNTSAITTALDSARRSNDTLFFRTSDGSEIGVKMEGIGIEGVIGMQDSLIDRYTKSQSDGRFLKGNQTITLSGDITGSGSTEITTSLQNTGTAGTYTKVTTDAQGRVTSGTTLSAGDIPNLSATYIPVTEKASANGVASLGSDGKVPSSQLPTTGSFYQGTWNANTNTPTIADGVGTVGWYYRVNVAGTQDLGSGSISFNAGDDVIYNGTMWQRVPSASAVTSVNGQTGAVVLDKDDVGLGDVDNTADLDKPVSTATQTALNLKANNAITLTAGTGLTGGGNLTANRSFAVNFGTAAGTVAQGNDSRINNGQTAFGWGNHASAGYELAANKSTSTSLGTSNSLYPTQNAVKTYVDAAASGVSRTLQQVTDAGNTTTSTLGFNAVNGGVFWRDGSTNKWLIRQETFPNAELKLYAYDDIGSAGNVFTINRSSRVLNFSFAPQRAGNNIWDAGNHPAGSAFTPTLTGANVPASFTTNSAGHVTGFTTRALTAGDIGAIRSISPTTLSWNTFNGTTTASFNESSTNAPTAVSYFGLNIPSSTNNYGAQVAFRSGTGHFRTLEAGTYGPWLQFADRGWTTSNFAPASGSDNYIRNGTSQQTANFNISGAGTLGGTLTTPVVQSPSSETLLLMANSAPSASQMHLTADGVGIGTTTNSLRASRLEVNGNVWSTDAYILGTSTTPRVELYISGGDGGVRTMNGTSSFTFDVNQTTEVMRITPNSRLGILTPTPASTLDVKGSFATNTRVINSNATVNVLETDHTLLFQGFGTGTGTNLNLPDPATCEGRELVLIENTASNWTLNYSISRTTGPALTTAGGTMRIKVVSGSWWLIGQL